MSLLDFTKDWSSSDNGSILSGQDLGQIQADLTAWANGGVGANNITAGSITTTMLANSAKVALYAKDIFAGNTTGFVATGFTYVSASGLTATFAAGRAYVNVTSSDPDTWVEVDVSTTLTRLLTGSSDNYVDLKSDGTLTHVPVAVGAAEPSVSTDSTRLALVTTDATSVLTTRDLRQLDPLYQIRNTVYTGSKNKIINGDFNIWQRGTSFAAVSTEAYRADRWINRIAGAAVFTIRRGTDVPTAAQSGNFSNYSMEMEVTTADATIGAGDRVMMEQRIEGYNWATLAQNTFVVSFWVKSSVAGTYCVGFRNAGADRYFVREYKIWQAGTWEKKSFSVPASPSAGTWDYTNGVGLIVDWVLAAGTNFQGTADAWTAGDVVATSNQVNAVGTVGNFFRLSQVQVEAGSYASPFEKRDIRVEIGMCERYYQKGYDLTVNPGTADTGFNTQTIEWRDTGSTNADHELRLHWQFRTRMRSLPTITWYAGSGTAARADMQNGERTTSTLDVNETGASVAATNGAASTDHRIRVRGAAEAEL